MYYEWAAKAETEGNIKMAETCQKAALSKEAQAEAIAKGDPKAAELHVETARAWGSNANENPGAQLYYKWAAEAHVKGNTQKAQAYQKAALSKEAQAEALEKGDPKAAEFHGEIAKAWGGSQKNPGAAFALNQEEEEQKKGNTEVAEAWRECFLSCVAQAEAYSQGNLTAAELYKQVSQALGGTEENPGTATALKQAAEEGRKGEYQAVAEWNRRAQESKEKAGVLEAEIAAMSTSPKNCDEYRVVAREAFEQTFTIFQESIGMVSQLVTNLAEHKRWRAKAEEALIAYDMPLIQFSKILAKAAKSVTEDTPHHKAWFDQQLAEAKQIKTELHSRLLDLLDFNTGAHQAIFWNGYVDGVQTLAIEFARENRKQTLELTPGGHFLDSLNLYGRKSRISYHLANDLFDIASERFARGANGEIHIFQAHYEPAANSVFKRIEEPVLKSASSLAVVKEENIYKKPKYNYWRTKGAAYESEEYRDLYTALEEAQHIQSEKVLWRELHLLRHEASKAFNTAFISMNEAVKASEVQVAISLFERAIQEAEKTQDLWSQVAAAFARAKDEVPETLKADMPKLLNYFESQAASWIAEIKWRQLRHQTALGELGEEKIGQLLSDSDSDSITTAIAEVTEITNRCVKTSKQWKSLEGELGGIIAIVSDKEKAKADEEKADKEKEYNNIKTTVAANRSKLVIAERAAEVVALFNQMKTGLKGFSKEEIAKKKKQLKEAFESYGDAVQNYQELLKRVEEAAPEEWSTSRGWNLIAEEWKKNKKAVEEARSNMIIKAASINDLVIEKKNAVLSLDRAKSIRMAIGDDEVGEGEDDGRAEDIADPKTPKITLDEFWEGFKKDNQALIKQFSPEMNKLILDMAAGKNLSAMISPVDGTSKNI